MFESIDDSKKRRISPVAAVFGILAALAGAFATRQALDWWHSRLPAELPPQLAVQTISSLSMEILSPGPFSQTQLPFPPEVAAAISRADTFQSQVGELDLTVNAIMYSRDPQGSNEDAAAGMLTSMRGVPGTASVNSSQAPCVVDGTSALCVQAVIQRTSQFPLHLNAVLILRGRQALQIMFIHPEGHASGETAWVQILKSIRLGRAA